MNPFTALPNRDASPVIRGFVYQVQRTIFAWLDLPMGMSLVCETGEDIDYVGDFLANDSMPSGLDRLSEQVKHYQSPISLRSASVIEALANAVATRAMNPDMRLAFRFFTNAPSTHEREANFPDGRSGIDVWGSLRGGYLGEAEARAATAEIRRVLREAANVPSGSSAAKRKKIDDLRALLESTDGATPIEDIISSFEFSTGNEGVEDLRPAIEQRLSERADIPMAAEARETYHMLFAEVFHRLCQPGEKRLDRPVIDGLLAEGTLAKVDRALIERIRLLLEQIA